MRVEQLAVPHAKTLTRPLEQIRRATHRLHPAGDGYLDVPGGDALGGQHHRLQSGAAHLVDREGGHAVRQPAAQRCLPRRCLPEPGGDDVAHDALVDRGGIDSSAAHGFTDDERTELRRSESLQ